MKKFFLFFALIPTLSMAEKVSSEDLSERVRLFKDGLKDSDEYWKVYNSHKTDAYSIRTAEEKARAEIFKRRIYDQKICPAEIHVKAGWLGVSEDQKDKIADLFHPRQVDFVTKHFPSSEKTMTLTTPTDADIEQMVQAPYAAVCRYVYDGTGVFGATAFSDGKYYVPFTVELNTEESLKLGTFPRDVMLPESWLKEQAHRMRHQMRLDSALKWEEFVDSLSPNDKRALMPALAPTKRAFNEYFKVVTEVIPSMVVTKTRFSRSKPTNGYSLFRKGGLGEDSFNLYDMHDRFRTTSPMMNYDYLILRNWNIASGKDGRMVIIGTYERMNPYYPEDSTGAFVNLSFNVTPTDAVDLHALYGEVEKAQAPLQEKWKAMAEASRAPAGELYRSTPPGTGGTRGYGAHPDTGGTYRR